MHHCPFCGLVMPPVPEAIDDGWIPSYWHGGAEVAEPVCPACTRAVLVEDERGDYLPDPSRPND